MFEQIESGPLAVNKTIKVQTKNNSTPLYFSSTFDSGNFQKLEIGPNGSYIVTPGNDCLGSPYESHAKGWFYFSVKGGEKGNKIKLIVKKLTQLSSQPVYRYQKQQWSRCQGAKTIKTKEDDTQLHIEFEFAKSAKVYFAYTYPFSYEECEKFLKKIAHDVGKIKSIYYCDQILVQSSEGRHIHLLTITSNDGITTEEENFSGSSLFQQEKQKVMKFAPQKKVVMISARVHPTEAPSSHTFNGLIKFLLSKDARAYYLRKNFIFKLIPMLNPDGVANGHYRMDIFNQNLNRFYKNPDPLLQPSVYAVKQVGKYYYNEKKLCFYMDLHAHPQKKGNFIYGNAFDSLQAQAQTQLFPKILSLNSIQYDYVSSSFNQKHMTLKDKNEELSKEGCGRVVFQKEFNLLYSYTMECGYTCSNYLNETVAISKAHRKFDNHSIFINELENIKSPYYSNAKKNKYFTIESYEMLGKNILVSILDLFSLNPASRIPNTPYQNLDTVRKEITAQLQGGLSSYFVRKFPAKPHSQQNIKQSDKQNTTAKTINNYTNVGSKPRCDLASIQKKTILATSHYILLQPQLLNEKIKQENLTGQTNVKTIQNGKCSTLPKLNFFKLNNIHTNLKLFPNAPFA